MKIPSRNRGWLKEIQKAYSKAEKLAAKDGTAIEEIYLYAADMVAKNRGVSDAQWIAEMKFGVVEAVESDCGIDGDARKHYKFHFASGYLFSHMIPDILDIREVESILEYVTANWDMFGHSSNAS